MYLCSCKWIAPRIYRALFAGVTSPVWLKWCNRIWVERLKNSHALGLGRGSWVYGVCVCLGGTRPCLESRGRVHFQMHAFSPNTQTCLFISISVSYHRSAAPVRLLVLLSVPKRTMPASCEVRSDINLHSSRSGEARVQQLCPRGATGVAVASASRRTEGTRTKRQLQHITTEYYIRGTAIQELRRTHDSPKHKILFATWK